ncbi:MAG TPA: prolipoprotein diacylglyceryl transferase family protein [Pirellulales bacterium]|nr:prolipoprotein diacylglyceryl transferase family protein [Pirellulales bacterium]
MLQTLVHIPHPYSGQPIFGFGWALAVWAVFTTVLLTVLVWRRGFDAEVRAYLPLLAMIGLVIWLVLPLLCDGEGLPIRGYGVMLLAGVTSGVGLAAYRARRMGLDPDMIVSLAFWVFIAGIFGARLFYIVEYWPDFQKDTVGESFLEMLTFTKGGLVVFGAAIGAGAALVAFTRRHRLPGLALADLIAPSVMLGLALGRVGCFCNGCCWGGTCDLPWAVEFPFRSPPHVREVEKAEIYLHGLKFESKDDARQAIVEPIIKSIEPGSAAEQAGLRAGDRIVRIYGPGLEEPLEIKSADDAEHALLAIDGAGRRIEFFTADSDAPRVMTLRGAPEHSLAIHPAQIYAAIDAALLCLFLLAYYPHRRHDGEVFALMVTIHPISRYVQEIIRTDESGVFGTGLSISQNLSLLMLLGAAGLWYHLSKRPRGSVWPPQTISA